MSSNESLARDQTTCLLLNDELCMVRPTLINMNPVERKSYPLVISRDKCSGSCNVLFPKIRVPKETKDIYVKVFNMITKNVAKPMTKHISCDCKSKFNSLICNSNQKWNKTKCQYDCKNYHN